MKIFVFAYNRFSTMTTSLCLSREGIRHYVLCHNEADKQKFIANNTVDLNYATIIATGNPKGLTRQRNYALNMLDNGEWALFMNDDLVEFQKFCYYDKFKFKDKLNIEPSQSKAWHEAFDCKISCCDFINFCKELIVGAKEHLIGFAPHNNPLFRAKRTQTQSLVDGRCILVKKSDLRFDEKVNCIEDHDWTAQNLVRFGKVRVEMWVLPLFSRMTSGGFGTLSERENQLRAEAKYLIEKFPYIFEYKDKKGYPPKTQLRFKKI